MNEEEFDENTINSIQIVELVKDYVDLVPKGKNFIGTCPFCRSKKGFIVNPSMKIFKCFVCNKGGNARRFIELFEHILPKDSQEYISIKYAQTLIMPIRHIPDSIHGVVYVLKLENNCYYIGFTKDFERRMIEHKHGFGSVWTRKHKPIGVLEKHPERTLNFENILTEKYIEIYGYSKVRGGDHLYFEKKYGHLK